MFGLIKDILSVFGDSCILLITFYTFYLSFISKKVKFGGLTSNFTMFKGQSISLLLRNKSLSPINIVRVSIIYDNKYEIEVRKFDEPLVVEGFKTARVRMESFTQLVPISLYELHKHYNRVVKIETTERVIYAFSKNKVPKREIINNSKNRILVTALRSTYNGEVISENVLYAVTYLIDNQIKTCLINNSGVMSCQLGSFNMIQKEILGDPIGLMEFLDKIFVPLNIDYKVIDIKPLYIPYKPITVHEDLIV